MKKYLLSLIACLSLTGCLGDLNTFTFASTKNIDFTNLDLVKGRNVTGSYTGSVTSIEKAEERAIADALSQNPCAVALVDVTTRYDSGYIAEGTEVINTSLPGCQHYKK